MTSLTAPPAGTGSRAVDRISRCCVIGSGGRMGGLFVARLRKAVIETAGLDQPLEAPLLAEVLPSQDLVLLAVPAPAMEEVLVKCAPHCRPDAILVDICSVKVQPLRLMLQYHPGPVVGTHPLFGQDPGEAPRVAVVPGRDDQATQTVSSVLEDLGFQTFPTTAETHDRAMAAIQGLNFVTTAAYLAALAGDDGLRDFLTPSFERRLEAARKMLTEDAALFADLFEANPYSQDAVRQFRSHLNIAAGGDVDVLAQRAGWWWRSS
ncbi:prephenate dehydrogenase [Desulfonatronum thiosulfatophilum]|uniref:Prephenate dehydrogenase n=1 Tax=Desulfonatronum thiosulfatophilum TaxID=617002 RepID=A0A1G6B1E3_9BACT|nr:prephenate dehydrogenase/arogenate dehydrogenase family protein [Desulfonatronum thiosulfatophilum]SDB14500.1 prephenate dehydrogenase [Desulfonatronum thiosulfatophilum]